jgi:hypothetical protein
MTGKTKIGVNYTNPTTEYRKLAGLNYSMIKKFDEDIALFYREFILREPREDKESVALNLGSLVDFALIDCGGDEQLFEQRMTEKFALFDGVKSSAQAYDLADSLFSIIMRNRDETGAVGIEFEEAFKQAFEYVQIAGKYKGKTWEKGLEDFNKVAKEYFDKKIENIGKIVVDLWQVEKSKNIVSQARGDEFHGALVNMETGGDVEVIDKLAIEFECQGWNCKMEQDRTIINHKNKTIRRLDYKTAYDNEDFAYSYLKRKYYLQNAFYHTGTEMWAIANNMEGYDVLPMEFLVFDTSANNRRPLKYNTIMQHVEEGLASFTRNDRKYKGVIDLMDEITWANENGIWNCSKENYLNRGEIELAPYEENE